MYFCNVRKSQEICTYPKKCWLNKVPLFEQLVMPIQLVLQIKYTFDNHGQKIENAVHTTLKGPNSHKWAQSAAKTCACLHAHSLLRVRSKTVYCQTPR